MGNLEFGRLDGELETFIVFATALIDLFEGGSVKFDNTAFLMRRCVV
jgi:hypothetical protein